MSFITLQSTTQAGQTTSHQQASQPAAELVTTAHKTTETATAKMTATNHSNTTTPKQKTELTTPIKDGVDDSFPGSTKPYRTSWGPIAYWVDTNCEVID